MLRRSFHSAASKRVARLQTLSGFSEDFMKRRLRVFVVGGFFLLAIVLPASITFYTDWLWFGEMGCQALFARSLAAQGTLGALAMGVAFVVLFVNLRIAMRMISPRQVVVHTREGPLAIAIDRHRMQPLSTAAAVGPASVAASRHGGRGGAGCALRPLWIQPVAGVAAVPLRSAVRRRRSGARQG